ncbi:MAG: glycosyltransferase, partial [Bacilli bacterium]|nr:glycosyltransferase [Bacilli bacterium]
LYGYRLTTLYNNKLFNIVKNFKPDIIHNQTDSTIGQFSKIVQKRLKVPMVYTYHTAYEDYTYYITKGFLDRAAKIVIRNYARLVSENSTEFITPSEKTMDYMRFAGSDIYMNVIPTGIDFSLFDEKKIDKEKTEQFKKEHGIKENTKVFLILGRIAKEKSMDISIKGYAAYVNKHPDVDTKLIIVGGGPQLQELQQLVDTLGISHLVDFIGPVPAKEVPFYYHLADIYTSASVTETQGLTFMEAMVAKDIVLARYDDNLSGTIIDGQTGFFFTNEESFIEKAERALALSQEEREEIYKNAYQVIDIYSIEKFYENILGVYNRAIKKYW